MNFKEWLLLERGGSASKMGLYPLAALGIYPVNYYMSAHADNLYYLEKDLRRYHGKEGSPFSITHIPGHPSHSGPTSGEGSPWKISHIK